MWTFLKIFTDFVTVLLLLLMFWFFGHKTCGIIAPYLEIEPPPPALEDEVFFFLLKIFIGP